jgi:nucleotide-binding universal stress UspA family protein
MRKTHLRSPSIVVGIDGSRAAVRAALWAVDEAVSRDIPLRLTCAIPPDGTKEIDPQDQARKLATAESAIRYAMMAVESVEQPVKIEVEIVRGSPLRTLSNASRSAAMICVGAVGLAHCAPGGVGSTAAFLASSAHGPVAIIRGQDGPPRSGGGAVLAYLGPTPDNAAVLQVAVEEARLRGARLQAVVAWQSRFSDVHDAAIVSDGNRDLHAQLDRRLQPWLQRHPDLDVTSIVVHGGLLDHLAKESESIHLVVMGAGDRSVAELAGPSGSAVLRSAACSTLFVSRQHL